MTKTICNVRHNARQINWTPGSEGAFISDLGALRATRYFGQIWADSCDEGFILVNPTTGAETVWCVSNVIRDAEGDIACWELRPTPDTTRKHPRTAKITLTIWND